MHGLAVLILVPHQDDEINIAGHTIMNFESMGAEVFVTYSTNGDHDFPAEVRLKEALRALKILGVPGDHVILLGYGDTAFKDESHIFQQQGGSLTSAAGPRETYGAAGMDDFALLHRGAHSAYNRTDFQKDIVDLIEIIRADIVICVDCDGHPDHRALSFAFNNALREVLLRGGEHGVYRPIVFKTFAYSLAYYARSDLHSRNILSTKFPDAELEKNEDQLVGKAIYDWDTRIRFPASKSSASSTVGNNLLGRAAEKYVSQYGAVHASRFVNGDDVFWSWRTDNLALFANVTASSGKAEFLNDFQIYKIKNVLQKKADFHDGLWLPDVADQRKTAIFQWQKPQRIGYVEVFGWIDGDSGIDRIRLEFDTGFAIEGGPLPPNGRPLRLEFESQSGVKTCSLTILGAHHANGGIGECAFYANAIPTLPLSPFVKIMVDDDFAYLYRVSKETCSVPLTVYQYGKEAETALETTGCHSVVKGNVLWIDRRDKDITVLCKSKDDARIFDKVTVRRTSSAARAIQKLCFQIDSLRIFCYRSCGQTVRFYLYLKKNGITNVLNRVLARLRH